MKRARAVSLVLVLALGAGSSRASDNEEQAKDSAGSLPLPATVAWRVPPANGLVSTLPRAHKSPSLKIVGALLAQLASEPGSKAKDQVSAAAAALLEEAKKAADGQEWIDSHLGELNAAVRAMGTSTPESTALKAAVAAAKLNNRAERWEEGLGFANLALGWNSEDRDALLSRSQAGAALGDHARAWGDADRVARAEPGSSQAWTARAGASYGMGHYPQALDDARRALALDPGDKSAEEIMRLAEGRTRPSPKFEDDRGSRLADSVEREYHGMVQQLNQVSERLALPPERPGAKAVERFVSLAGSKLAVKDYWGAIDEADRALELSPSNGRALYYRAAANNLLGRYGEAARDCGRGLALNPADAPLRDARAWAYNRMGRFADAIADSNHSLEIDPKDAYAFANRAYAREQRGDYEAMADDLKAAELLDSQFSAVYRDAARRHGLAAEGAAAEPRPGSRVPERARSFAVVLASSLAGGLLIGLGLLHVGSGLRERRSPAPGAPPKPEGLALDYEIGRPLGQGGMGVVYEAFDRRLKRRVALKMLRDEYKLDDAAKSGFLEEARTVAELRHPAIVEIFSIVSDARGVCLVFERLDGTTLDREIAAKGRLLLPEIKRVLGPVCEALEYAHSRDVVHRDLKPSNVMLSADGGIKVMDFGISRHAARAGKAAVTQTVVGTPQYMAPEQEYGHVRKESDVFSLGAVLYEMVTGQRPFDGGFAAKIAKSYPRASSLVPGVSIELDALVERALEPDPDLRIPTPAEFGRRLAQLPDSAVPPRS